MHFLVIKKKLLAVVAVLVLLLSAITWLLSTPDSSPATTQDKGKNIRDIHMVTGEFKSKTADGKEIEAYRWDPGIIFLDKEEMVRLKVYGVNGEEHPFTIEGTSIKGMVKKGQETVVPLQFEKEGVYRLICLTHPSKENSGPMIAYIVVD
ncbi:hypothetical protein [Mesobacillus zeae]|uniref:EfeO-type cupredoxin-like domain-containing protein n=1 Tax=Mesobacillus zeae TaxID=1917180 RepID=A0A398B7Y1_9BACI|nr:hypothetical protein [Mesobacillus zeae]RID85594.1 hypothetical protein D1970_08525 [Mesobacillus zeae]